MSLSILTGNCSHNSLPIPEDWMPDRRVFKHLPKLQYSSPGYKNALQSRNQNVDTERDQIIFLYIFVFFLHPRAKSILHFPDFVK